jgi:hypothetical protein
MFRPLSGHHQAIKYIELKLQLQVHSFMVRLRSQYLCCNIHSVIKLIDALVKV